MPKQYGQRCPMALSLEVLGERWTLLIIRDLLAGPGKFRDLASSLHAPPGMLSRRLKLLEEHGIVQRRMYAEHPPRAEYSLTPRGTELRTIVRALTIWGSRHLRGERVLVHRTCEHPIEMAYRCAHCDELVDLPEIVYQTNAPAAKRDARQRRGSPIGAAATLSRSASRTRRQRTA